MANHRQRFSPEVSGAGNTAGARAWEGAQLAGAAIRSIAEREVRELRRANETLRKASALFAQAELDPALIVALVDQDRGTYGVEPICAVLPIAPSRISAKRRWRGTRLDSRRGRSAKPQRPSRSISWTATSQQRAPTSSGCRISRTSRRGGLRVLDVRD